MSSVASYYSDLLRHSETLDRVVLCLVTSWRLFSGLYFAAASSVIRSFQQLAVA